MTLYNGERTTLAHTATADGLAMVPDDNDGVFITVYSSDFLTVVLAEQPMVWSSAQLRWEYVWDTSAVAPATYQAKVRILGFDSLSNWDYFRFKLARDKVPV